MMALAMMLAIHHILCNIQYGLSTSFNAVLAYILGVFVLFTYQAKWLRQCAPHGSRPSGPGISSSLGLSSDGSSDKKGQSSRRNGKRKTRDGDEHSLNRRERDESLCTTSCRQDGFLGCPFAKANPLRYSGVHGPCTYPRGFKKIGSLKYVLYLVKIG